jgi:hypothetical protein
VAVRVFVVAARGDATAPPVPTDVEVDVDVTVHTETAPPAEAAAPEHCGSWGEPDAPASRTDRPTTDGQGATPDGAAVSGGSEEGAVAMT